MKRIFTLFLSILTVTLAMAQNKEGVFFKASTAPVIDGVVDAEWAKATKYDIDRAVGAETPTVGVAGETYWQGLWTDAGVYILINITDNAFYPNYLSGGTGSGFEDYNYDKLELYFDVNYVLVGEIAQGARHNKGHYQVTAGYAADKLDGTSTTGTDGVIRAFKLDGNNILAEYFVPFKKLLDAEGVQIDKTNTIGFDVTVIDRDPGDAARNQAVWSNEGTNGASWDNLDDAGRITFENASANVAVENITLNEGGTITVDNGTLQMVATITPSDATIKDLKWSVENGTGKATIDQNGLLSAVTNGTVTVKAAATDGMGAEVYADVEISGQNTTRDDVWNSFNLLKNWDFNTLDATTVSGLASWGGWLDGAGQMKPVVEEGVVVMTTDLFEGEQWHYQFSQNGLQAMPDVPYVVSFKSWADAERPVTLDFEDTEANGYNRYGASSDAEAVGGRSEWAYTLTTEAQWFTFHVTFDQIVESTNQKMQWLQSQAAGTIYLDSVLLVTEEEYDLLQTLPVTGITAKLKSIDKVYPNPVANTLNVKLSAANSKVAIYNAIGQKLMEKTSTGNRVTFDVSSLRKGMYFVKLEDGSVEKFIK